MVGRPGLVWFERLSDNTLRLTSVMLYVQSITLPKSIYPSTNSASAHFFQHTYQIVGVLLLDRENSFKHSSGSRVVVSEVSDHLAVTIDRDAFGNEIFFNHVQKRIAFDVFRVTAHQQAFGIEVRFTV